MPDDPTPRFTDPRFESPHHHLAQFNVGVLRAPLDSPRLAGFMAQLAPINALADRSPGFVWRLQTEAGDATAVQAYEDPAVIVNYSIWTSLATLWDFTYRTVHLAVMRDRRDYFAPPAAPHLVLWWVPAGEVPPVPVPEAVARLDRLRTEGPSPAAFTFRSPHPPPGQPRSIVSASPARTPAG